MPQHTGKQTSRTHRARRTRSHPARRNRPCTTRPLPGHRRRLAATRGEVPSVLALLTDPADFAAMRRYPTFPFTDHRAYLKRLDALLRSLAGQGVHVRVVRFRPDDFVRYCRRHRLDPDSGPSRAGYTAHAAHTDHSLPYTGQPVHRLLPLLGRHPADRTAPVPGDGPGPRARNPAARERARALGLVLALLEAAGPGRHHLVCSVSTAEVPHPRTAVLSAVGAVRRAADRPSGRSGPDLAVDEHDLDQFTRLLADAAAGRSRGGVVLRTRHLATETVRGWQLSAGGLRPLSASEVFAAYCTDATTGEPLPPEPGVDYQAGFPLPGSG
ncbi:hypothetical protein QNO07_15355 [Streptomyces sp. 549]|uniref:hypothetical protein n=1 Tax=Streptomyces sp. 549 TaxID=3049076 RepID=UPI0024C2A669|nr:hypothetical protein [Streptomyces sp. 549]MDK1474781.1 hypothetical protein [Streptomyces sp. 549]